MKGLHTGGLWPYLEVLKLTLILSSDETNTLAYSIPKSVMKKMASMLMNVFT
jgi:hypothetical protein